MLTITRKKSPAVITDYRLGKQGNVTLQRVHQEKYLGTFVKSKLSWDSHIFSIVSKANTMLGILKRTCPLSRDTKVRRTRYLTLP